MIDDIRFYARILSSRLPAMAGLFLLASGIGLVVAVRAPTTYATSAKLLVESPEILDTTARAPSDIAAAEQLEVIQQRLMTRANLLDVARQNAVFANASAMSPDDIVEQMRERTAVTQSSGRNKATLMTIRFSGPDPQQVAAVVNQYVTIVLSTNSSFRAGRAQSTLDFFQQEVDTLSQELDRQSARLVEFKNTNADALPETLEYRMSRQALLQERLSRSVRDLDDLQKQRASIQRAYEANGTFDASGALPLTPEQRQLQTLEQELSNALAVYSPQNPKIRLLQAQVDALRERLTKQAPASEGTSTDSVLNVTLAEIDTRIAGLQQEIASVQTELEALADGINRTPSNRIAIEAMERQRADTQALYSAAVQRLNQARMTERIELSSKGERISVLEPASVPDAPSSPNRPKIVAIGVAAGLALAGGLFVLLELVNQSVRRPGDIVARLDITPLATLPRIETAVQRRLRRLRRLTGVAVVAVSVPALLWALDTYYMPLDRLFSLIVERLT
ncbi:uncharacterized protein involved in exopolysaccharide biosynthesis [Cereibacter ovatus]|uniref:Uncharacterized protein involved in exopolysaccharide biosynthesis n=1 Tax=Cereibacter ovatus TaxID=439529 RepID=A0A285D386_9RHOB|nr:lipopolysaccharide biosynthesis [Cereibacter ovatus]SNX74281.1 uncharacterized protein involved in exopolysaccharide biosynthesis [Cereibacter ovatus]